MKNQFIEQDQKTDKFWDEIFPDETPKPEDYKLWCARERWNPAEAACLLKERSPEKFIKKGRFHVEITDKGIQPLFEIIKTWCGIGDQFSISPYFYIEKALQYGIKIPEELWEAIEINFRKAAPNSKEELFSKYPMITEKCNFFESNDMKIYRELIFKDLPPSLQIAIEAYYETWHGLPKGMAKPTQKEIIYFLENEKEVSNRIAQAIFKIIQPEYVLPGPATGEKFEFRFERNKT
jgi:hypothetical protein